MRTKSLIKISGGLIIVIFVLLVTISISIYFKNHPCIEYEEVCQEKNFFIYRYRYRDVDCSEDYDRIIQRCEKRK